MVMAMRSYLSLQCLDFDIRTEAWKVMRYLADGKEKLPSLRCLDFNI